MKNFKMLNINELKLDKQNPRLPITILPREKNIIEYLAKKTNIEDLMISISTNNFFKGETIVVTPTENGKYIVLEGNRRLTALRLLQDPTLAGDISSIKKIWEKAQYKPVKIWAYIVDTRENALQYLGFRHISGVQRWDPMAKARYLKLLFDQIPGEPEQRYITIAREIGSKSNAVRRSLDALAAYEAIKTYDFFEIKDLDEENFQFGVFYTAVGNLNIASFIGIRHNNQPTHPIVNPDCFKTKPLNDLTEWIFQKDSDGYTRLGESRNISKLSAVVAHPKALEMLRNGLPLKAAFDATKDNKEEFLQDILIATQHLRNANSNLHSVSLNDEQAVRRVREAMKVLDIAIQHLRVN